MQILDVTHDQFRMGKYEHYIYVSANLISSFCHKIYFYSQEHSE
jgi:hypothetical protein